MGIGGFERKLERLVEGTFTRLFRSGLQPVELGRRLQREMDAGRRVGVNGRTLVPNHFTFRLSQADFESLADLEAPLRRELGDAAREHARDEGAVFVGPIEIELEADDRERAGMFRVEARFREGEGGAGSAALVLPTGDRVPLGEYEVVIGRHADCTVVLADPNASRRHAVVLPEGEGFVVQDLGSTNGTRVNGTRVGRQSLADGDEVRCGNTVMRFEEL